MVESFAKWDATCPIGAIWICIYQYIHTYIYTDGWGLREIEYHVPDWRHVYMQTLQLCRWGRRACSVGWWEVFMCHISTCIYIFVYVYNSEQFVYVCACVYVYMYVCMYAFRGIYACMHLLTRTFMFFLYVCIYARMHLEAFMYVCICWRVHLCIYVCMRLCMYAFMYVSMYVRMHLEAFMYVFICWRVQYAHTNANIHSVCAFRMHLEAFICMYAFADVCIMYLCMYAFMYVCI